MYTLVIKIKENDACDSLVVTAHHVFQNHTTEGIRNDT